MKFFILFLLFTPSFSFGLFEGESDYFGSGEYDRKFEKGLSHFSKGMRDLLYLAGHDYPLAQQMLGALSRDANKAKRFIKNYNNMHTRPLPIDAQTILQELRDSFKGVPDIELGSISEMRDIANPLHFSQVFSIALKNLTDAFHLFDYLESHNYMPAREFQINFKYKVASIMLKSNTPLYTPSKSLSDRCRRVFSKYYSWTGKKTEEDNTI